MMAKPPPGTTVQQQAEAYALTSVRRHILFCSGPDCCEPARGETVWNYLKKRIAELKLDRHPTNVFRTRCQCLRVCTGGPIAVVHPDGTWYHSVTPEVLERILQEHVLEGRPVQEYVMAEKRLE
jgi:(2Fe-2S) ferredoxin